jgi:hypothetical protein
LIQGDGVVAAGADGGEQFHVEQTQNRFAHNGIGQFR